MALSRSRLLAPLAVVLFSSSSALAVEGEVFAQRLQEIASQQGTPLRYDSVRTEGETVILDGFWVGEGDGATDLGTVRFETVTGSNADGWRVERVPFSDFDEQDEETRTTASGLVLQGLTVAPQGEASDVAVTGLQFERAGLETLSVTREGEEAFRLDGLSITNSPGSNGGFDAQFEAREFLFDATAGEEDGQGGVMEAIGYPQVRGDISGNSLWNTQTGELSVQPLRINLEDAGELSFSYTITGYTPAFVQSLSELQRQMSANPENSGASMALFGLLSQLYLNEAELSFTDNSLTNRLLDYYASENNTSREDLITSLVGSLPAVLNYLNNPEFQAETTQAVERFLRDPQSLTIAIEPGEPVPAPQIMGAAMGAPQTLPALLDLSVSANQ